MQLRSKCVGSRRKVRSQKYEYDGGRRAMRRRAGGGRRRFSGSGRLHSASLLSRVLLFCGGRAGACRLRCRLFAFLHPPPPARPNNQQPSKQPWRPLLPPSVSNESSKPSTKIPSPTLKSSPCPTKKISSNGTTSSRHQAMTPSPPTPVAFITVN